jgi:hypothetical protein
VIHNIIQNEDGTTTIHVDFSDEGVDLVGETRVKGDENAALVYLPFFEADLRRNFAEKFPIPDTEEPEVTE